MSTSLNKAAWVTLPAILVAMLSASELQVALADKLKGRLDISLEAGRQQDH